jgi:hypothetical protein
LGNDLESGGQGSRGARRRSNVSGRGAFRDSIRASDQESLTRIASIISQDQEHNREGGDNISSLPTISRPKAARSGPASTIREIPSEYNTPLSTRPPSPVEAQQNLIALETDDVPPIAARYPDIGSLSSWRGAIILLVTCGSQLLDNVFMTGVNISLPAIQKEFNVESGDLQWLISAYTLTFGGFLLLAGVLSDR